MRASKPVGAGARPSACPTNRAGRPRSRWCSAHRRAMRDSDAARRSSAATSSARASAASGLAATSASRPWRRPRRRAVSALVTMGVPRARARSVAGPLTTAADARASSCSASGVSSSSTLITWTSGSPAASRRRRRTSGATAGQRSTSRPTGGTSTAPRSTRSGLAVRSSVAPAAAARSTWSWCFTHTAKGIPGSSPRAPSTSTDVTRAAAGTRSPRRCQDTTCAAMPRIPRSGTARAAVPGAASRARTGRSVSSSVTGSPATLTRAPRRAGWPPPAPS